MTVQMYQKEFPPVICLENHFKLSLLVILSFIYLGINRINTVAPRNGNDISNSFAVFPIELMLGGKCLSYY